MSPASTTGQPPSESASLPIEPPCLVELERIQIQEAAKKKPGELLRGGGREGVPRGPFETRGSSSWALGRTLSPEETGLGRQEWETPFLFSSLW